MPNCPCNNAWYFRCPFTSAYLCAHWAVFEHASLGPGASLCEWQRHCLILLGTASVATWVIQSACSSPSSTRQIELFPHLHTERERCAWSKEIWMDNWALLHKVMKVQTQTMTLKPIHHGKTHNTKWSWKTPDTGAFVFEPSSFKNILKKDWVPRKNYCTRDFRS